MTVSTKSLFDATAADLMSRALVTLPPELPLREAALLLAQHQISGAPVVNAAGRCVGMLSATDFMHWAEQGGCAATPRCTMPCEGSDWQVIDLDMLPTETVSAYMTADLVTVAPTTGIRELARRMLDAHLHRLAVVDEEHWLIGLVSSTDLLAAVAYAESDT
jgi:CBS-domain-containing membrane protein